MSHRKRFLSLFLIVCSLPHLSMRESGWGDVYGILDSEDGWLAENQDFPALHSVAGDLPAWESHNRWLCFPVSALEVSCRDHESDQSLDSIASDDRDEKSYCTVMDVSHEGHFYRFESPGRNDSGICLQEIEKIKTLLEGQKGFCVFAAKSPSDEELSGHQADEESSLWTFYGVKTLLGRSMAPIYEFDSDEEETSEILR